MVGNIIYLCRHGSHHNDQLLGEGKQQMVEAANRLTEHRHGEQVSALYHSPIARAVQSARILKENLGNPGLSLIEERLLDEDVMYAEWTSTEKFLRSVAEGSVLVTHKLLTELVSEFLGGYKMRQGISLPQGGIVAVSRETTPWNIQLL